MGRLTAAAVRSLKHPADRERPVTFLDGDGLLLQVTAGGSKSWILRYQMGGRAREMGLGSAATTDREAASGAITLAKARDLARAAKALARAGKDPIAVRREQAAAERQRAADEASRTFKVVAEELIEGRKPGWRNAKHAAQWEATLKAYAYPVLEDTPVANVATDDVLRVLRPVWTRAPETASRLRCQSAWKRDPGSASNRAPRLAC